MQASQSRIFAAPQGLQQGQQQGQQQGLQQAWESGAVEPFFTSAYFDSLRRTESRPTGIGPAGGRPDELRRFKRDGFRAAAADRVAGVGSSALSSGSVVRTMLGAESPMWPVATYGVSGGSDRALGAKRGRESEADSAAGLGSGLAHDIGNLLSALSLYSELLASPQVLGVQHRHYAADLKLLAERSGTLIDRLVALGAEVDGANAMRGRRDEAAGVGERGDAAAGVQMIGLPAKELPARSLTGRVEDEDEDHRWEQGAGSDAISADLSDAIVAVEAGSNLVDVLVAYGGVLSTMAGGALEVTLGSQAGLPIAVRQEALERILVNLVRNAALAVERGGSIRILAGLEGRASGGGMRGAALRVTGSQAAQRRRMVLTVDDSGCGMSEAKLAELQGRSVRRSAGRRGIGLQVVRELVVASGGSLQIESREGIGTRVEIAWPTLAGPQTAPRPLPAAVRAPLSAPVRALLSSPVLAPARAPTRAPVLAPVLASARAPVSAPARAPVLAPVSAPAPPPAESIATELRAARTSSRAAGRVSRMEMVAADELEGGELTEAERELLAARSDRPVMAAESVVRQAALHRNGGGGQVVRGAGATRASGPASAAGSFRSVGPVGPVGSVGSTVSAAAAAAAARASSAALAAVAGSIASVTPADSAARTKADRFRQTSPADVTNLSYATKGVGVSDFSDVSGTAQASNSLDRAGAGDRWNRWNDRNHANRPNPSEDFNLSSEMNSSDSSDSSDASYASDAFDSFEPSSVSDGSAPPSRSETTSVSETAREQTLDRSFVGSLQRSLEREQQREQQRNRAGNEGAIAC